MAINLKVLVKFLIIHERLKSLCLNSWYEYNRTMDGLLYMTRWPTYDTRHFWYGIQKKSDISKIHAHMNALLQQHISLASAHMQCV